MIRKVLIVALIAAAASMTRCTTGSSLTSGSNRDDDDRPPIIVTNGSMNFDDGDPKDSTKWKDWTQANGNSAKQWTQKHQTGFDVSYFSVDIAGSNDPKCPASTSPVYGVAIEYTPSAGGAKTVAFVERAQWSGGGKKWEPWVTLPSDAPPPKSSGTAPPRLIYDPGNGYISYVTLTTGSAPVTCSFPQAQTTKITIQPQR